MKLVGACSFYNLYLILYIVLENNDFSNVLFRCSYLNPKEEDTTYNQQQSIFLKLDQLYL